MNLQSGELARLFESRAITVLEDEDEDDDDDDDDNDEKKPGSKARNSWYIARRVDAGLMLDEQTQTLTHDCMDKLDTRLNGFDWLR